jgi:hypothetical protein
MVMPIATGPHDFKSQEVRNTFLRCSALDSTTQDYKLIALTFQFPDNGVP